LAIILCKSLPGMTTKVGILTESSI